MILGLPVWSQFYKVYTDEFCGLNLWKITALHIYILEMMLKVSRKEKNSLRKEQKALAKKRKVTAK